MNHYLPGPAYDALVADLTGAFMRAATSAFTDLHDALTEALAVAGIMPEECRGEEKSVGNERLSQNDDNWSQTG